MANIGSRSTASGSGTSVASGVAVTPVGGITSTDAQSALAELDTKKATPAQITAAINALVAGAPGALDTLNEIAVQLASDESAAAALTTAVAAKLAKASNLSDLANLATARTNLGAGAANGLATLDGTSNVPVAQLGNAPDTSTALIGAKNGQPIQPWAVPPTIGPELWVTANFKVGAGLNSSTLTPSLTQNGSGQTLDTQVALGNLINQDLCFRVSVTVPNAAALVTGTWAVLVSVVDASNVILSGTVEQTIINSQGKMPGPHQFDFKVGAWGTGGYYLRVRLSLGNNNAGGDTLGLSNVTVREVATAQRPMTYGLGFSNSVPTLWQPLFDPVAGIWRSVATQFGSDSALTNAFTFMDGYNTDKPFRYDSVDPDFLNTPAFGATTSTEIVLAAGEMTRSVRANNDDQVMEVQKADLTYELRCNTHGGETPTSAAVFEVDRGDGNWVTWDGLLKFRRPARRFRFTNPSQVARSAPDSDVFATVARVSTFFPDGVMRCDRTTTFTKTVRLKNQFDWLSSHDVTVPKIGRIGTGLLVLDEVDIFPKVAPPAAPTLATATTGGTLAAGTYAYSVTALGIGGETTASLTTSQVTTGSTSANTITWVSVANATGYRVYGRLSGVGLQTHLGTFGPAVTSFVDDGSAAGTGTVPPIVNKARRLDATTFAMDAAVSDKATWAVWYDPILNMCMGNIYDRDAVSSRTNVLGTKLRLEGGASIIKNYLNTYWVGDGNPILPSGETQSIPSGTVWTVTHYAFCYVPADPVNYHNEIALRASNLAKLKTIYPAT